MIESILNFFIDLLRRWQNRESLKTLGAVRSSKWPAVRKKHLEEHPVCAICGSTKRIEVHHIIPFNIDPTKELDPNNIITLCESGKNGITCHLARISLGMVTLLSLYLFTAQA